MNRITSFPDAYIKDEGGNLYNVMQLLAWLISFVKGDFEAIDISNDLYSAAGDALDKHGEMFGVKRNGETDEQYRVAIFNKVGENKSDCTCNSAIRFIAQMFNVPVTKIRLEEIGNAKVVVSGLSNADVNATGYSFDEIKHMISAFLPSGVGVDIGVKGTFVFVENEGVSGTGTGYDNGTLGTSVR